MKSRIFLPYYNYNDNKFDVSNYYQTSDDYIKALNQYGSSQSEMMQINKNEDEMQYASCECIIGDETDNEMTIDKFVGFYNNDNMVMLVLNINSDDEEDEFETQLNEWFVEHEQISKLKISENEKYTLEPKRDIKMIFDNLANKETYCVLTNTTIIDKITPSKYIVVVDRIIFTKSF